MTNQKCKIGMIGLGVMGRNLVLNIAEHGFAVAGYDKDTEKIAALKSESKGLPVYPAPTMEDFISLLEMPRVIMMLVPAGAPVDSVIADVLPHLSSQDIIIDGGNSHFTDTDLRAKKLTEKGIMFLGMGVSGGEAGARHGPSIMPGGPKEAYDKVRPILEAVAAKVNGFPCVTYIGPGSAGHYVKMVHNGIEYALLQLIAEMYDLMKREFGWDDDKISDTYRRWNQGRLNGFLIEITAEIFKKVDEKTGNRLIDEVLDEARQKGTGLWTSESAMQQQIPVPTINTAVEMRDLSCFKGLRIIESVLLDGLKPAPRIDKDRMVDLMNDALYAAMIMSYSQGFALLYAASRNYKYNLNMADIAAIWRGGCIIRSGFLENITAAYRKDPALSHLMADGDIACELWACQDGLRQVVSWAVSAGIPVPGLMSAVGYFDSLRSPWLPANLIQAQRDYFGYHTYERIDEKGTFHTKWSQEDRYETIQNS
jgi:6-phosphogluconate dehydrogenase